VIFIKKGNFWREENASGDVGWETEIADVQMRRYADVRMWGCEDVRILVKKGVPWLAFCVKP